MSTTGTIHVGAGPSTGTFRSPAEAESYVDLAADEGLDHLFSADHVTFRNGMGIDGLIQIAWILGHEPTLSVNVGVYLLALRHPVAVARQLATLAQLAPGRVTLGVGVGGEDPYEFRAVGVDPKTRGSRTDESLDILRRLLAGEAVTSRTGFFELDEVRVRPAPDPPIPVLIGGRSEAALHRTAHRGDGWLGIWSTPERYATAIEKIEVEAAEAARYDVSWQHGIQLWCGIDDDRSAGRRRLADAMESTYGVEFAKFERYSPWGSPDEIVDALVPFVEAGCSTFNLSPVAPTIEAAVRGVGEIRRRLLDRTTS